MQKRAARAVALRELSSARQTLEGEVIAPGTMATLRQLTDESKRPPRLMDPVPLEIMSHTQRVPFALDTDKFLKNVRSAQRGAAAGPSGMTVEHLRPLLDSVTDQQWLCKLAEQVAQGRITPTVNRGNQNGEDDGFAESEWKGWLRAPWPSNWDHKWSPRRHRSNTPSRLELASNAHPDSTVMSN